MSHLRFMVHDPGGGEKRRGAEDAKRRGVNKPCITRRVPASLKYFPAFLRVLCVSALIRFFQRHGSDLTLCETLQII